MTKYTFDISGLAGDNLAILAKREGLTKSELISRALALYEIIAGVRDGKFNWPSIFRGSISDQHD